jgi:hypothetical protein
MTKVQNTYKLSRPLVEADAENLKRVHSIYGIYFVRLNPTASELLVEYDASRLTPQDLQATLEQHGLPIVPSLPLS